MKPRLKKAAAAALAMSMCVPGSVFAAGQEGTLNTSFDVYSPALTIQVPVNADIRINPIADTDSKTVKKFTVASNSLDVWNASVDADTDTAIPVNVTVKASIASSGEDVVTEYNTFTENLSSTKKKIHLELSEANKAATIAVKSGETAAFKENKLDFDKFETSAQAEYDSIANKAAITKFGSLLSIDIAGPTTSESTAGATFTTDATKVTAAIGSFAVTGVANANADWKADDVTVAITYSVKASQARSITMPTIGTAPTFTSGSDVTITVPSIGESTVTAVAMHNDSFYGDFIWDNDAYTVDYSTAGTAKITIPKDDAALALLLGDDYKGKAQDLIVALSDGRFVVSTLTAN